MTTTTSPLARFKRLALVAALAAGASVASAAVTSGTASAQGCGPRSTFQAFARWGDLNQYFVVPNATFESGTAGWTFYRGQAAPSIVNDQAPWRINGANHARALQLPAYSTAQAPNMCIASDEEWMRLFFRDPGVGGSQLLVKIEAWSAAGRNAQEYRITSNGRGWKVSPQIPMPNMRDAQGNQTVTITITSVGTAASWLVDDVMVDPWRSR